MTGGSSMAAMIFKAPPQLGAVFDVDVEDPFEQPGPTHAHGASVGMSVIV